MEEEHVVLVDEHDKPLGTVAKSVAHTSDTPLHRGFSVFLFNADGEVLSQQRSHLKQTWPLIWSGSCCGHPALGESTETAIRRRVSYELGISEIQDLQVVLPDFRYKVELHGLVENELCPVWRGVVTQQLDINPKEVENYRWMRWVDFVQAVRSGKEFHSEWALLQIEEMERRGIALG